MRQPTQSPLSPGDIVGIVISVFFVVSLSVALLRWGIHRRSKRQAAAVLEGSQSNQKAPGETNV
ncbi:hypothetical protein K491DRAFT_689961 [Lophiostoma macrostomum CBS 122681]|uniref:Uncharacterized protein n=1 Tax=Lophiostoma macrostomum CBS 122681 TaxID=1314788 RepID=A0A6A6TF80_9PLEO|nr:hypothetical protein K491DRAFT_689961 [Lophiostoma macrostomum CBS 122681]